MVRELRPRRFVSSLLALAAVVGLSVVSITPVQAATNATLGDLSAANPAANKYAGCVASVLTGSGVTFGSAAAMDADLAALWPNLPAAVTDACKLAVDGNQPQVCINPADPATCPAIGAAAAATAADLAASLPGNWKIATDGVGSGGYAQATLPTSGPSTPTATATGTFNTPVYVCTTKDCANLPSVGLFTDCGATSCGPVTSLTILVIGRTPNGESGVQGHVHVVDGFGNVSDVPGFFGQGYWGTGCGATECVLSSPFAWTCKARLALPGEVLPPANCGGQSLTVSFTFDSGAGGGCGCATAPPRRPAGRDPALRQQPHLRGEPDRLRHHDGLHALRRHAPELPGWKLAADNGALPRRGAQRGHRPRRKRPRVPGWRRRADGVANQLPGRQWCLRAAAPDRTRRRRPGRTADDHGQRKPLGWLAAHTGHRQPHRERRPDPRRPVDHLQHDRRPGDVRDRCSGFHRPGCRERRRGDHPHLLGNRQRRRDERRAEHRRPGRPLSARHQLRRSEHRLELHRLDRGLHGKRQPVRARDADPGAAQPGHLGAGRHRDRGCSNGLGVRLRRRRATARRRVRSRA